MPGNLPSQAFDDSGVLWGPYQDFRQLVTEDPRFSVANPLFGEVDQPGLGRVLSARGPLAFKGNALPPPTAAPVLGADTVSVLQRIIGLAPAEIRRLRDRHVIDV